MEVFDRNARKPLMNAKAIGTQLKSNHMLVLNPIALNFCTNNTSYVLDTGKKLKDLRSAFYSVRFNLLDFNRNIIFLPQVLISPMDFGLGVALLETKNEYS